MDGGGLWSGGQVIWGMECIYEVVIITLQPFVAKEMLTI